MHQCDDSFCHYCCWTHSSLWCNGEFWSFLLLHSLQCSLIRPLPQVWLLDALTLISQAWIGSLEIKGKGRFTVSGWLYSLTPSSPAGIFQVDFTDSQINSSFCIIKIHIKICFCKNCHLQICKIQSKVAWWSRCYWIITKTTLSSLCFSMWCAS